MTMRGSGDDGAGARPSVVRAGRVRRAAGCLLTAALSAALVLFCSGGHAQTRLLLTAPATIFISPTGQDTPSCGSANSPCATRGYVWSLLNTQFDMACQFVTIVLMNGLYTEGTRGSPGTAQSGNPPGNCYFHQIKYVAQNPGGVLLQPSSGNAFLGQLGASFEIDGLIMDGSMNGNNDLVVANSGATVLLSGNTFRCAPNARDIQPGSGSTIIITGETVDKTGCPPSIAHIQGDRGHIVLYNNNPTIVIAGNPTFTNAFLVNDGGLEAVCGVNFSASFNGPPFIVYDSGTIVTCAAGPQGTTQHPGFLPGTTHFFGASFATGSTTLSLGTSDAATLAGMMGNNVGLLVVGPCLQGGTVIPSSSSIGTTVQITTPTVCGAPNGVVLLAGGFVHSGGQYFGTQSFMGPPR